MHGYGGALTCPPTVEMGATRVTLQRGMGSSLVVQGLRLLASNAGGEVRSNAQVRSLARELRSHMMHGMAKKKGFKKIKRGAGMGSEFDRELVMK